MKNNIKILSIKLCYPIEEIFNNIVNSITDTKTDEIKYPYEIFYFNNNEYIASYNKKTKYFWCNYRDFWPKFALNNTFDYLTIKYLLNGMIEEHFKLKNISTLRGWSYKSKKMEEHFKLKNITTLN
jgi:hypothetical protein